MEFIGVRQTTVREPELLIEALEIDSQDIPLPFTHGAAVIKRIVRVTTNLAHLLPAIQIDQPPIVIHASDKHENTLMFFVFDELNTISFLILTRATGRQAI